ncbi:MAG: ATP-binding cassette domain-containing protein [Kiloniellales bacterium]|nr:ATP-binding cassette domain-containing protein [Kiloniellales bacterium]
MTDCTVELTNLSVTYPSGQAALDNVSLTLTQGMIYGLVGANGAGKSTLFKSIMGFVAPTTGQVSIAGHPVRDALRRNLVSYVPQTEDVDWNFPVCVNDVVMMGRYGRMGFLRIPSARDKKAVYEALQRVEMTDYAKCQIGELSGGQKKRVFVARALAQKGRILLFDEPFAGVDIKTEESLILLLRELAEDGQLILVSTHNLGSVPNFCDEVILIDRSVLAFGPIATTFTQQNLLLTFGGMLRNLHLGGPELHQDRDKRGVTVLTDDERPLVLYGEEGDQKIVAHDDEAP